MIPALLVLGAVAIGGFAIRVATRPNVFRVTRKATLPAPPERIYPLIEDLRRWREWSPWEDLDPALERSYSGAESGTGAIYHWKGNKKAGEGRMEIRETDPNRRVVIALDFLKPFAAHNVTTLALAPAPSGTEVVWSMEGPSDITSKMFQSVVNMDRMVGRDFEKGLERLGRLAG